MATMMSAKCFANPTTGRTSCFAAASAILALITLNLRLGVFLIGLVSLLVLVLVHRKFCTEPVL